MTISLRLLQGKVEAVCARPPHARENTMHFSQLMAAPQRAPTERNLRGDVWIHAGEDSRTHTSSMI